MPLHEHLCSQQNIGLARTELFQNAFETCRTRDHVSIEPENFCVRNQFRKIELQTFGSRSHRFEIESVAFRALIWNRFLMTANMAAQKPSFKVHRRRDRTVGA